jgi:hypothetical protein
VFTARYELSPYIKQIRFVFKGLINICATTLIIMALYRYNASVESLRESCHIGKDATLSVYQSSDIRRKTGTHSAVGLVL